MSNLNALISLKNQNTIITTIGAVSTFRRGSFPQPYGKAEWYDGDGAMPFVQVADIGEDMQLVNDTKKKISIIAQPMSVFAPKGSIIISLQGSIGRIAVTQYDAYIDRTVAIFSNISSNISPRYFVYQLQRIFTIKKQTARGGTIKTITKEEFTEFPIVVPPLEVQEEIVRILDEYSEKNTQLISALSAELDARKIQYEYYREQIFANKCSGIEPSTIKDVCIKTCSGGTPKTSHSSYYGGDIPWLRTQEVDWEDIYDTEIKITDEGLKNSSAKLIPENCVIVAMYGATAAKSAINKIPLTTNQACCNLQIDPKKAQYRYVYYWLCYEYLKLKSLGRGSQDNLNADMIKNYPIVVPALDVQDDIIATLDKYASIEVEYEKSIQDEIKLRQTQYEYYRDKLLTFEEAI